MTGTAQVSVLDLGMGNLRSVARAFGRVGAEARVVSRPEEIAASRWLVVPGQGAFRDCAKATEGAIGEALLEHVRAGRPYLGLCLGMQVLFEASDEAPGARGLGIFAGHVRRFDVAPPLKVPHMGWNEVDGAHPILPARDWFYFVHSFHCVPVDRAIVAARTEYGGEVVAGVARDNVIAVQFHPEKSQDAGERVLAAWIGGGAWS